jgi:hypothetical protein
MDWKRHSGGVGGWRRVIRLKLGLVLLVALSGGVACRSADIRYPGTTDARAGGPAVIQIEPTGSTETSPRLLEVAPGTEVTFRNSEDAEIFIRFTEPMGDPCGTPVGFDRTSDGRSYVSRNLLPFGEARLCFATPGRYDFVVSRQPAPGPASFGSAGEDGESPVVYGTVLVE